MLVKVVLGYLVMLILIKLVLFVVVLCLISIMVHLKIIILIIWIVAVILFRFVVSFYELVVLVNKVFCHIMIGNQSLPLSNSLLVVKTMLIGIFDLLLILVILSSLFLVNGLYEIFFALYKPFTIFCIRVGLILL